MAWFRKRQPRINLGVYVAPEIADELPVADLVDEAVLIASAGVRISVKNLIILRALRDHHDYDEVRIVEAVRQELQNMADEKDADADRLAQLGVDAHQRPGQPAHHDDYRRVDTGAIERREAVSQGLAVRLRELSDDDEFVCELVRTAHGFAWDEIAASVEAKLQAAAQPVDKNYKLYRNDRLLRLIGDLNDLEAELNQT